MIYHWCFTVYGHYFKLPFFPRIIAGGNYFFFRIKKGRDYSSGEGDYSREAIISNVAHGKSCPKYFVLFSLLNKKIITSNKLSMGFFNVPN